MKHCIVVQNVQNFTNTTLSSFYFETIKDRLYYEDQNSESRRMAQTVLYEVRTCMIYLKELNCRC